MSISPVVHAFILQSVLRGVRVLNLRISYCHPAKPHSLGVFPSSLFLTFHFPLAPSPFLSLPLSSNLLGLVRLLIVPSHPLRFFLSLPLSTFPLGFGLSDHLRSPPPPSQFIVNDSLHPTYFGPPSDPQLRPDRLGISPTLHHRPLHSGHPSPAAPCRRLGGIILYCGQNPCWLPCSRLRLSA